MSKFAVPFVEEVTSVYVVEARSRTEATMLATVARERGESPTHRHVTKFRLAPVNTVIEDKPDF